MFGQIASRYDLANHLLSGWRDVFWRKHTARRVSGMAPQRILDLAAGSGDLLVTLGCACPAALIVGADFCAPMLQCARAKGARHLALADALHLPFANGAFDSVTVAFGLRNMHPWSDALAEMRRVLRTGGRLFVLDFSMPPPPFRWIFRPYLRYGLPWIAALVTGQRAAYQYLAESIEQFPQGNRMCDLIKTCGFVNAHGEALSGGIVTLYEAS